MNMPWRAVDPLDAKAFAEVKTAAIFDCCKWDPQVEDVCSMSPLPIVLTPAAWRELVDLAEALAREMAEAEAAVLRAPRRLKTLGLPWRLRRRLAKPANVVSPTRHLRLIRFDFHLTSEGWRISEANSDVPGGFNEASGFTKLIAERYAELRAASDPAEALVRAIDRRIGRPGTVALIHATAYSDDRQVMAYLARRLKRMGHKGLLAAPDHLIWRSGKAFVATGAGQTPVDLIFRFFPADWLAALPWRCDWGPLLGGSLTPLCNPGLAIICQSKRFPLLWDTLSLELPTWNALLPRTYDVRAIQSRGDGDWVFKPAFGRAGEMIGMRGATPCFEMAAIEKSVRRYPQQWVAQERFNAVPLRSAIGDVFPCIGVYTLDGTAIGAYGRIAEKPLIDQSARDAAILLPKAPVSMTASSEVVGDHGRH